MSAWAKVNSSCDVLVANESSTQICSLSAPAASTSQRRVATKKAQVSVKSEDDIMASQTVPMSQGEADMQTVAAVLSEGPSIAKEADDAAVPLVDRLAGKQHGRMMQLSA